LLGYDDDIVGGTVVGLLEEALQKEERPNAKRIHVAMSGLLGDRTLTLVTELWDWLDDAQRSKFGVVPLT
jgi:hypothetical protein